MNLGAEPKKVAILGALLLVGAVVLYLNVFSGDSPAPTSRPVAASIPAVAPPVINHTTAPQQQQRRAAATTTVAEFKLRQGPQRPEDRPDPASIDPTLRLDLLAKLQTVEPGSALRNIFQYGAAPPPPKPVELPKNVPKIPINHPGGAAAAPSPGGPPPPPPPPPITFKYYGYRVSKASGRKEAFLLDGEDIIIAGENEAVKRGRYKVIRIGIANITIEDTQFKHQQTLKLEEAAAAA